MILNLLILIKKFTFETRIMFIFFLINSLRLEYSEAVKMLNENGIQMTDEEDLSTTNEKFLGKLVRQKVINDDSF